MITEKKAEKSFFTLTVRGVFTFAAFIFFIIFGYHRYVYQGDKLRKHHRYTIATVYKTHWSLKSGKFADSKFTVQGVEYTVSADADKLAGQQLIGRRFLVEFHPPEPDLAVLYLEVPIPEDVTSAPTQGWSKPPFSVPAEVLE